MNAVATRVRAAVAGLAAVVWLVAVSCPAPAAAQVSHPPLAEAAVPPPPPGDATVRGSIVDTANPGATAGLEVTLYALSPGGAPGVARTQVDAAGAFAFEGVSSSPGVVYLIAVRYGGVPYGERAAFTPGQQEIDLDVEVERPVETGTRLRVAATRADVDWRGSRLLVEEAHRVTNAGDAVVFVPIERRDAVAPPFRAVLPAGAESFRAPLGDADDGFTVDGDTVTYWGPFYRGEQTVRYSYLLPATGGADVTLDFPDGTGAVEVRVADTGPEIAPIEGLTGPRDSTSDGQRWRLLAAGPVSPGGNVAFHVDVPATTSDLSAVTLGTSQVQVELDDTVLTVTQVQRIIVAEGTHVAGSPEAPLLRFPLPPGADLEGLSTAAGELGITPSATGIEVLGPIGPGEHEFAYRYRVPAPGGQTSLALSWPLTVPVLALQAADTGLRIESPRLHRRRPERLGTRTWLVREAFHVEPSETVEVAFRALDHSELPRGASLGLVLAAGAAVALFVVGPLRRDRGKPTADDEALATRSELDLVYMTIRDLDHDFETGKVSQEDYDGTRAELRQRAIGLLRAERDQAAAPAAFGSGQAPGTAAGDAPVIPTAAFCPGCGGRVAPTWRFCTSCGGALAPGPDAGTGSAA